jgi:hypothetical protein
LKEAVIRSLFSDLCLNYLPYPTPYTIAEQSLTVYQDTKILEAEESLALSFASIGTGTTFYAAKALVCS